MAYKLTALLIILGLMVGVASAQLMGNAPYHISNCPVEGMCCEVPVPMMTEPVPGGTPTVVIQSAITGYGVHVTNTGASNQFLMLFDATATPAAGATPIGASSWAVPSATDRDISIGEVRGMSFVHGEMACCSSTQGTFTAGGPCGFILQYY
jgi:hypothetical protein